MFICLGHSGNYNDLTFPGLRSATSLTFRWLWSLQSKEDWLRHMEDFYWCYSVESR